ncbi:RDD family protein [Candidatus Chlorohelix sp.]|uniref:RDD family protein n=1 Tax=Candidatus Chlorohelix sp. TaxID=3139201 RepID=UPI0030524FFF
MYCNNCGKFNLKEANFCYNCGQALELVSEPLQVAPAPAPVSSVSINTSPQYYSTTPQAYYGNYYNAWQYPSANYNPVNSPNFLYYHPLAYNAAGITYDISGQPSAFYSYVDEQGKLVLLKRANHGKRLLAGILDWALGSLPGWIMLIVASNSFTYILPLSQGIPWWASLFSTLCFFSYFLAMTALVGQTLGKMALGIRVVRYDGNKPGWLLAFIRQCLGYPLNAAGFMLGFLSIFVDSRRQGWHDKMARTLVVEERNYTEGRDFTLPPFSQ